MIHCMRNNSLTPPVSVVMFKRISSFAAISAALLLMFAPGCKRNSSDGSAPKDSKITGKPTDPAVAITPTWKPGNKYLMRLERAQVMPLPGGGGRRGPLANAGGEQNNAPLEVSYAQEYTLVITNADGAKRGIELEITGIELQTSRGEEVWINYDSQNKAAPKAQSNPMLTAVVAALDRLIGGKVHYLLTADGTVEKIEGVNEFIARADGTNTGRAFAPSMILKQALNEDTFRQMVEFNGAPKSDVKIGDSWPYSRDVNAPNVGKLNVSVSNTLKGWQQHEGVNCARVEFAGTITSSGGATNRAMGGARINIKDGKVNGHYWYDPAIGLAREMQLKSTYTINASGPARGTNSTSTNQFTAPVTDSTSMKLIEVKPAAQG
jgi:hypothetical protein